MTNREIVDTYNGLYELRRQVQHPFAASISYAIVRNLRMLQPIVEDIDATRREILERCGGALQEDGNYIIPPEHVAEAQAEIENLESFEENISLMTIKFDELSKLNLTVKEMDALYPIVRWEEG